MSRSPPGGDVETPQCSESVGDDLILDPPDCRVPHLLRKFAAIFYRGWTASPVVVELGQGGVNRVRPAGSQAVTKFALVYPGFSLIDSLTFIWYLQ